MMNQQITIFDGKDIKVYGYSRDNNKPLFITFTYMGRKGPHPSGFGESYLAKMGFSAIHFISNWNHFWQTSESLLAAAAATATPLYRASHSVITYGSSMGATGAIIFSKALNARRVIAISPQMSIDLAKAPFESRFAGERDAILETEGFIFDDMAVQVNPEATVYVPFDPLTDDSKQYALIAKVVPKLFGISLPGSGHPAGKFLKELNLLSPLLMKIALDQLNPEAFLRSVERACLSAKTAEEPIWSRQPRAA